MTRGLARRSFAWLRRDLFSARRSGRLSGVLYQIAALFLLAFALVAALSVSGGIIAFCIKAFIPGSLGGVGPPPGSPAAPDSVPSAGMV
ncbi:MAG: hypothetical protein LBS06_00650 [Treponema sp.]|nr:hypothetical protein [Treponema sp.]